MILLAIDLGTEGARVGAFSGDGDPLGSVHRGYRTTYPRPGWAEQDPEEWWAAVVDATRTLLASPACTAAGDVVAVACATTASTVAVLDADGRPLRPAILWMDSRAWAQSDATAALVDAHPVLAWSGGSDAAEWLLPKAVWVAEHEPEVFALAARVVEAIDYLTFRLTGRWVGSQMNAVCKYNYDPLARSFPTGLYVALGVPDLADGRAASVVHHPHLAAGEAEGHIVPFLRHDLRRSTRRADHLSALLRLKLHVVDQRS